MARDWHGICIAPTVSHGTGTQMNRHQQRVALLFGLLVVSAVLLGCANSPASRTERGVPPAYEQDLARARAAIDEAEQSGAAEFGGPQLTMARDKLRAAENAAESGAGERAQQLAVEADLDADLATAITRNRQTRALVAEVESGLRTLEQELRRGESVELERR
jgi:hypothetical protein